MKLCDVISYLYQAYTHIHLTYYIVFLKNGYMVEFVAYPTAWYWYMSIGLAAVCLGIPIFLIYWIDKKKKRKHDKRFKIE